MNKHRIAIAVVLAILVICLPGALASQEQKKGRVQISVTGGASATPVKGADVLVRSASGDFQETNETNAHGVAILSNVPQGALVILVTARGWRNSATQLVLNAERLNVNVNLVAEQPPATPSPSASPSPTSH